MAFGDEHQHQPIGRNNKRLGTVLMATVAVVAGGLAVKTAIGHWSDQPVAAQAAPINLYTPPNTARRSFKTGYAADPEPAKPPVDAPAPAPVKVEAARPITAKPVVASTAPQPPKPLPSGFIGQMAPAVAAGTQGSGHPVVAAAGRTVSDEYRPGMSDGVDKLGDDDRQGLSAQKNRWLATAGSGGVDVVAAPWMPAVSPQMIQAGTIIAAVTQTAINSDLPGDVVAMIPAPVCDTPTGDSILIPPNTKLLGRYSDQLSPFQERAQLAWYRILFPDGSSQNIGSMPGVDVTGASGVAGEVDTHTMGMAGAVALAGGLSVVGQTGQILNATEGGGGSPTAIGVVGAGAGGAGETTKSIGAKVIQRQLDRPNTLTVQPGTTISLMLTKDLALPAYHGQGCGA